MNGSKWSKHILRTHILSTRTRHIELLHQKLGLSEVLLGATAALAAPGQHLCLHVWSN